MTRFRDSLNSKYFLLIQQGLWLMQKWKKSDSLSQLSLHDNPDLRQTFIYRLSQSKGIPVFYHCPAHANVLPIWRHCRVYAKVLPIWRHCRAHANVLPIWRHCPAHANVLPIWRHCPAHANVLPVWWHIAHLEFRFIFLKGLSTLRTSCW